MSERANRQRLRYPSTRHKGDVVCRVIGETYLIRQQEIMPRHLVTQGVTPEAFVRDISEHITRELWKAVRNYFTEAIGVEMAVRIGPIMVENEALHNLYALTVYQEATIAPLYTYMASDSMGGYANAG